MSLGLQFKKLDLHIHTKASHDFIGEIVPLDIVNKAIEKATNVNETELAAVAKEGMPNIPGMDMFK